jgi:hypothetical protein
MRDRVCRAGLHVALECGNIGPAQKARPAPVMTTTRIVGSSSMTSKALMIA